MVFLKIRLYFDYINDQGGIHGLKIKLRAEDDGYQPSRRLKTSESRV